MELLLLAMYWYIGILIFTMVSFLCGAPWVASRADYETFYQHLVLESIIHNWSSRRYQFTVFTAALMSGFCWPRIYWHRLCTAGGGW